MPDELGLDTSAPSPVSRVSANNGGVSRRQVWLPSVVWRGEVRSVEVGAAAGDWWSGWEGSRRAGVGSGRTPSAAQERRVWALGNEMGKFQISSSRTTLHHACAMEGRGRAEHVGPSGCGFRVHWCSTNSTCRCRCQGTDVRCRRVA